jgi:hypothetical protein
MSGAEAVEVNRKEFVDDFYGITSVYNLGVGERVCFDFEDIKLLRGAVSAVNTVFVFDRTNRVYQQDVNEEELTYEVRRLG